MNGPHKEIKKWSRKWIANRTSHFFRFFANFSGRKHRGLAPTFYLDWSVKVELGSLGLATPFDWYRQSLSPVDEVRIECLVFGF